MTTPAPRFVVVAAPLFSLRSFSMNVRFGQLLPADFCAEFLMFQPTQSGPHGSPYLATGRVSPTWFSQNQFGWLFQVVRGRSRR